jgi:hypothetical protein
MSKLDYKTPVGANECEEQQRRMLRRTDLMVLLYAELSWTVLIRLFVSRFWRMAKAAVNGSWLSGCP